MTKRSLDRYHRRRCRPYLSVVSVTLCGMDHPWRRLRDLPQWDVVWCDLPVGTLGFTDHDTRTIWLQRGQLQAQRRSTLAHELEHVARGPVPAKPVLRAREEAAVEQAAARQLINLEALGEALAWATTPAEVADELWVDEALLLTRLQHLHPAEKAYLKRRLDDQPVA